MTWDCLAGECPNAVTYFGAFLVDELSSCVLVASCPDPSATREGLHSHVFGFLFVSFVFGLLPCL